jgi:N-acetylglucosamine-6-phosphate deacetylase
LPISGNVPGFGCARLEVSGGTITAVEAAGPLDTWLAPGFIDIQINGFAGVDFNDPLLEPEQAASVLPALWRTGCTTFCPTLVTNTLDALARNFRVLEAARRASRAFAHAAPCYHLEGPWVSPGGSRGVHNPAWMGPPDWDAFCRLQQAAGGRIRILTVAPEWPGMPEFIARAAASDVVVALGHTDASHQQIHHAAECGATLSTHLGNGCPGLIERHAAPLWAQMADGRLAAGIICDGFHLPADVVRVIARAKGIERLVLVTDAVHVATRPPGRYRIAGAEIELLPTGKVVKVGDTCLAGSAASMDGVVAGFMRLAGAGIEDAVRAATLNPARIIDSPQACRAVAPGQPANLVAFHTERDKLKVRTVWAAGEEVFDA